MFIRLYIGRLKCLLGDRLLVFWTMLFPLALATLFHFGFGNMLSGAESFSPVPVAVVENDAYRENDAFRQALDAAASGDSPLLALTVTDADTAENLLKKGEVDGVILPAEKISLTVKESGLNQNLVKTFLDEYAQTEQAVMDILARNPAAAQEGLFDRLTGQASATREITLSGAAPNTMLQYFYALIAMACLFGGFWGMRNTTDLQADLSAVGARRSIAPTHKLTAILSDECAALTVHFAGMLVLLAYLVFVLRVDFGRQIGYVLLTCLVGATVGVSLGTLIGTLFQKKEGLKTAFLLSLTLTMSFLAGLMFVNMKDIVAHYVPVLSYLNPAALISDAFYCLYIYESHTRFFLNIGLLVGFSLLFGLISFFAVRRQRYVHL